MESGSTDSLPGELKYIQYNHSLEATYLPAIRALISKDLSEPYSIYVYRYFLYQWGHLCYMVGVDGSRAEAGYLDHHCLWKLILTSCNNNDKGIASGG